MKITVIGTGYVGLVSGTCFAETGNTVYCVDKDQQKLDRLNQGLIPIYEPGLETLVVQNHKNGRLIFTSDLQKAVNDSDVCFIAVGTPQGEDGSADLSAVYAVARTICEVAKKEVIIATKSTVPVGTGDAIEDIFSKNLKYPFVVFSNPEFLKEGDAVNDFMKPDRVIIGTNDDRIKPLMSELYAPFNRQSSRLIFMSRRSAEITKYAANAMLATRISFMNEMANLCEAAGGNINDVRQGVGSDPRIGSQFLYPGLGYGGSCFPKDVKAILKAAELHNVELQTIAATDASNQKQPRLFFNKIKNKFLGDLRGKTFAVWGLAFKAKTDDIRCSPALNLIDLLLEAGAKVRAFDPEAMDNVRVEYLERIQLCDDKTSCLDGADALVIATDWNEFRAPDFAQIKSKLSRAIIFDGRNLLAAAQPQKHGFEYVGIGLG